MFCRFCSFSDAQVQSPGLAARPQYFFEVVDLDEESRTGLHDVLNLLGLKMGVVDLKFAEDGEAVWLEMNPQGQFLFVEGLTGLNLTSAFTDFLYQEATEELQLLSVVSCDRAA